MKETVELIKGFFEDIAPEQMLSLALGGRELNSEQLTLIQAIKRESEFPDPIINVLLQYSLVISNGQLNGQHIEQIAAQWQQHNVQLVEQAMC
ncbi:DnaD domain protein [Peribacillus sp. SCS-155]|uniref:DnaD domain protein n=1 Tax=Peribacillus sedimenti TaxID=3115297 RepID=UPI0039062035